MSARRLAVMQDKRDVGESPRPVCLLLSSRALSLTSGRGAEGLRSGRGGIGREPRPPGGEAVWTKNSKPLPVRGKYAIIQQNHPAKEAGAWTYSTF